MKAAIFILPVFLVCFFGASTVNSAKLCDVIASTNRIVDKLCKADNGANQSNQTLIDAFYGCYDDLPGKDQFEKCQTRAFGEPLKTVPAVQKSCADQKNLVKYFPCLIYEFKKDRIPLIDTVLVLNECQSKALGI